MNNIFVGGVVEPVAKGPSVDGYGLWVYDGRPFPVMASGNVYLNGARPYKTEEGPVVGSGAVASPVIEEDGAGVYLRFDAPAELGRAGTRRVTAERLGRTVISELGFTDPGGAPVRIESDYLNAKRSGERPTVGPFEGLAGRIRVW